MSLGTFSTVILREFKISSFLPKYLSIFRRFHQALLVCGYYDIFDVNWSEILLHQYVILDRKEYLNDFMDQMDLSDNIIENIIRNFQLHAQSVNLTISNKIENNLEDLVRRIQSVTLKYKMASLLSFKKIIMGLINSHTLYYLKDSNYGKLDINF